MKLRTTAHVSGRLLEAKTFYKTLNKLYIGKMLLICDSCFGSLVSPEFDAINLGLDKLQYTTQLFCILLNDNSVCCSVHLVLQKGPPHHVVVVRYSAICLRHVYARLAIFTP